MTIRVRLLAAALLAAIGGLATAQAQMPQGRELCVGGDSGAPLRLRAGPSTSHRQVGSLPAGACGIRVAGRCADGWCEVELGGSKGWADARFVVVREGGRVTRGGSAVIAAPAGAAPAPAPAPAPLAERPRSQPQVETGSLRTAPAARAAEPASGADAEAVVEAPAPQRRPQAAPSPQKKAAAARAANAIEAAEADEQAAAPTGTERRARSAERTLAAPRRIATGRPLTRRELRLARREARLQHRRVAYLRPVPMPRLHLGGPRVQRIACVTRVWPGDTLRVRTGPGVGHRELAGIHPGTCGVVIGPTCAGAWCRVNYRGIRGWSNAYYLRPVAIR